MFSVARKRMNTAPDDPSGANGIQALWVCRPHLLSTGSKQSLERPPAPPIGILDARGPEGGHSLRVSFLEGLARGISPPRTLIAAK